MLKIYFHPLWHLLFESLAYMVGFKIYAHLHQKDFLSASVRNWLLVGCILGAALGSKLIVFLENPSLGASVILEGKGIVGALIGGWIGVEITKKFLKINQSTGDLVVLPLIAGIGVGRIGCFLTGYYDETYGNPTNLLWAVDFGDGVLRHPTQLYEILFLIVLGIFVLWLQKRNLQPGVLFKVFMIAYVTFRFVVQFIKPTPHLYFGLDAVQIVALGVIAFYFLEYLFVNYFWKKYNDS